MRGGNGGLGGALANPGGNNGQATNDSGGGGGGVGRIRVNSTNPLTNSGIISPAETTGPLPAVEIPTVN